MLRTFLTEMRKFILKLELFLLVSGFVFLHKHHLPVYKYWVIGSLIFLIIALAFPDSLRSFRRALQKISGWWGKVVNFVILIVVYFLAIVPIGLLARLFGKDFLALRLDRNKTTYWIPREKKTLDKSAAEHQF